MSLTATLKNEHQGIFRLLEECREMGMSDEGRRKLKQVKGLVIAHLAREDSKLYPQMQNNIETKDLAATYAAEMKGITQDVMAFFNALEQGRSGMDFARQMGATIARLRQRMTREEVRLYPAFDQHCA
ncbi:hypothetical protein LMG23992_00645 [Cupriavidus laharis]|uniref:Hemerythrin-like domain-containing protein n=1 Tax=Cupriavidus laharis TaxID=151654 RepID=A0ABN7Y1X3_9BURK|nr:hemerythrin domain-containing protein [Cupriavidus laharis]CAG9165930.1 hypothetical protein LMG23992_00645 [Cupriavidus laharis]